MRTADAARAVVLSTLIQWATKLLVLGLGLFTVIYLTRAFGPADYGRYATALAIQGFAVVICDWGLAMVSVRHMSAGEDAVRGVLPVVVRGRVLVAVVVTLGATAVAAASFRNDSKALTCTAVALAAVVPATLVSALSSVLQVRFRLHVASFVELASRAVAVVVIVLAVTWGAGPAGAVAASVAASVFSVVALWFAGRPLPRLRGRELTGFKPLLREAVPVGFAGLLNTVYFRIDAIILVALTGFATAGKYAAAYRVMEAFLVFPSILGQSILPLMSRRGSDGEQLSRLINGAIRFLLLTMTPVVAVAAYYGQSIMGTVGGDAFRGSGRPLEVLMVAGLVSSVDIVLGLAIISLGRQGRALWLNVSGLALNVGLNLALIPRYGATGAASATLISELFVLVCALFLLRAWCGLRPDAPALLRLVTAAAAGLVAALVVAALTTDWLGVAAGVVGYAVVAVAVGAVNLADVRRLAFGESGSALTPGYDQ